MMVRNTASVVKGEEDFVSLHISNLPECFPNRGNSDENMHWVKGLRQDISGVVSILISHCPTWRAGSCKQMLSRRQLRHPETQQFLVGILNFLYWWSFLPPCWQESILGGAICNFCNIISVQLALILADLYHVADFWLQLVSSLD